MGNDNHVVVSYKLCGFQGRVGGRVVVMKEPVVVAPKFRSLSSHIFSQASQNVTAEVRVDRSVGRNKFTVNNPLHIEKNNVYALCWTPDLPRLFCSWWLWALPLRQLLLCFWIITVNPTFVTCYYRRDKSWVLVVKWKTLCCLLWSSSWDEDSLLKDSNSLRWRREKLMKENEKLKDIQNFI
jgi:hypothetical protein